MFAPEAQAAMRRSHRETGQERTASFCIQFRGSAIVRSTEAAVRHPSGRARPERRSTIAVLVPFASVSMPGASSSRMLPRTATPL